MSSALGERLRFVADGLDFIALLSQMNEEAQKKIFQRLVFRRSCC